MFSTCPAHILLGLFIVMVGQFCLVKTKVARHPCPDRNGTSTLQTFIRSPPKISEIRWVSGTCTKWPAVVYRLKSSKLPLYEVPSFVAIIDSSSSERSNISYARTSDYLADAFSAISASHTIYWSDISHGRTRELGEKVAWAIAEHQNPFNCNLQLMVTWWKCAPVGM